MNTPGTNRRPAKPAPHKDHRLRIKKKYALNGIGGWLDHEVLEFILCYAIARKDIKPIAHELLKRFKTFDGVLEAPPGELAKISGISDHTALLLNLFRDVAARYMRGRMRDRDLVSSPGAAVDYLRTALRGLPDEEFHVLFLNTRNLLLGGETIQRGTVNRSVVYPRKIVERALYHKAAGVIIAHNHPSGSLQPSDEDRGATEAVRKALATVDVMLLDHIIVGGNGYFSWKEQGLL